jgi:DNA topoisomerase-1
MANKKLVIIEAPGKKSSFEKYLGKDYEIIPTVGHVLDLSHVKLGVDIDAGFKPNYVVIDGKEDILNNILKRSEEVDEIYFFTDLDREGCGISANIYNKLSSSAKKKSKRAKAGSITKQDLIDAIKNAKDMSLDEDLVNAYETRRILDRIVGFKTSFITKQATGGDSAGRCQSAALRIIADREKEIINFIPIVYWPIDGEILTLSKEKIEVSIKNPKSLDISTEKQANNIIDSFKKGPLVVSFFETKNTTVNPYAPFTTSTLQQAASSQFGYPPEKTMKIAQQLYTIGKISYHRTDSTMIVPDFIDQIRDYISKNNMINYVPKSPNVYKTKQKNAQEAHEAIRPTDIQVKVYAGGDSEEARIYELIWKRTVSSQMTPALYARSSVEFSSKDLNNSNLSYELGANGSKQLFDGWKKVWDYNDSGDKYLPIMKIGEKVDISFLNTEEKKTLPPSHYSGASLIGQLEKSGVGRPATFAAIVKTLKDRKYVENLSNSIKATELGIKVSDFLISADFCFIDLGFTSELEDKLDDIVNKKENKLKVLTDFWNRLKLDIDKANKIKNKTSKSNFECPLCKAKGVIAMLMVKNSKFGSFYSCENYSSKDLKVKCIYKAKVGEKGPEEIVKTVYEYSKNPCPKCNSKMIKRTGKFGIFYGCEQYFKTKCNGMLDKDENPVVPKDPNKKKRFFKKKGT